jgi:hypothetical protein
MQHVTRAHRHNRTVHPVIVYNSGELFEAMGINLIACRQRSDGQAQDKGDDGLLHLNVKLKLV